MSATDHKFVESTTTENRKNRNTSGFIVSFEALQAKTRGHWIGPRENFYRPVKTRGEKRFVNRNVTTWNYEVFGHPFFLGGGDQEVNFRRVK